jgi:hypothetical protein
MLVAGITCAAYAEVQNVKVSGDLTVYGIARNDFALTKGSGLKNENTLASITRIRVDADLTDNVIATVRLLNERYWGGEATTTSNTGTVKSDSSRIDIDLAYVTMKEFLYSPLTLMIGRQELHFGNDMIIGDVDTNRVVSTASAFSGTDEDLSARKAFDAIRATLNYDPLIIDVIYSKIRETNVNNNDDQDLYGINAKYDLGRKNTTVEGYFFSKQNGKKTTQVTGGPTSAKTKKDKTYVIGSLVKSTPIENLSASLEAAYQFGTYVDVAAAPENKAAKRRAYALQGSVGYKFPKVKFTPNVTLLGGVFSGDKNPSTLSTQQRTKYTGWDPMFENQTTGHIANSLFTQSNVRLVGGIASIKPADDVTLQGEYYAYWWDRKYPDGTTTALATVRGNTYTMRSKRFAGQEFDAKLTYDYTEDVQFALLGGMLIPGAAFNDTNQDTATEVIGSMKVTF